MIADQIEDPEDELRRAVKHNFQKGVHYLFLISKSRAPQELDRYVKIFMTLAEIITKKNDLVEIRQLPYDWPDYPYVFYETLSTSAPRATFIAFRGNQRREGIADEYFGVPPHFAHTIAVSVLSGAPEKIVVEAEDFETPTNVVPISAVRGKDLTKPSPSASVN